MIVIQCMNDNCKVSMRINEDLIKPNSGIVCPKCQTFNRQPFKKPPLPMPPQQQPNTPAVRQVPPQAQQPIPPMATSGQHNPQFDTVWEEYGWIVVHDETTHVQTYPLKLGVNVIGRKGLKPADILIETTDRYMSQRHCLIEVKQARLGVFTYCISDIGKIDGKTSKNGTFINAKSQRLQTSLPNGQPFFEEIYLKDGDLIQLGRTKIRLKTPQTSVNKQQAQATVLQEGYARTILL